MPHDKNGNLLDVGDEVLLRCKITQVSEGETQCNVTAEAAERPEGEGYIPTIAGNSRFYERANVRPSQTPDTEAIACSLYEIYCKAVGGVAFNGYTLPSWEEFSHDTKKQKQADAWRAVATAASTL